MVEKKNSFPGLSKKLEGLCKPRGKFKVEFFLYLDVSPASILCIQFHI